MQISKSDYMHYLKHPAWLWLKKHDKSKIPPVDDATQAMFNAGYVFESYVESLFADITRLGFESPQDRKSLPARTRQAIDKGKTVLAQPGFEADNFSCICDIVRLVDDRTVDLYEIKSSTRVKQEHLLDLAFQVAVLRSAGYLVRHIYLSYANNKYVRQGEVDAQQLVTTTEVTEQVLELQEKTLSNMQAALAVANQPVMPDPDPKAAKLGSKKEWIEIYHNIHPPTPKTWPSNLVPRIDNLQLSQFMDQLQYPLYFFDYETMQSAVPYFNGQRPYQQIPFQYSVHVLHAPGGEIEHREYLHRENSDPSLDIVQRLIQDLDTEGSVIVWNQNFEKTRNYELGLMHPQYAKALQAINDRVVDLMIPFKSKWYDDPRFEGKSSIKNVLPVVCPELSYADLGIQQGNAAQRYWMEAILDNTRPDQKQQILDDLVEYCKMDTWAMLKIYQVVASSQRLT